MLNREKKEPCMGFIKNTLESHKKTQTIAFIAIGVSIVAIFMVFAISGSRNATR